ncbi:hypothetical protein CFC21_037738 [Triticum aestivum]|uniref:DUF4378 domain-containing protein n=3 Tax=Triticum TaxID=4564 RepID=A0A9R0S145_TRITD|nr:hypothetical protein CFC21_037738 [Triticum aestivum]VAH68193.1 unnamed protein product [Triticum turgidum subsp. durum]
MACLSSSPSGRRLSELLEERQEPFFLDLHLLEKGCSGWLLDGYDTALCWPAAAAGNDAASVLKRLTSKKKKAAASTRGTKRQQQPPAGSGLLRLLISKILQGKVANQKPAALQCSESFKRVAPSPLPCSKHLDAVKLRADAGVVSGQETEYSDSEYDDEKQHSPVSVLEHPFESSPVHGQSRFSYVQDSPKNAMAVVRELLMEMETAYTPALCTQLFAKSEGLVNDANDLADHDGGDDYYYRTSPKNFQEEDGTAAAGSPATSAAYWATHRAELARVSELVSSEVPRSRLDAASVQPERRDVGADIESALLDALVLELVMDLGGC